MICYCLSSLVFTIFSQILKQQTLIEQEWAAVQEERLGKNWRDGIGHDSVLFHVYPWFLTDLLCQGTSLVTNASRIVVGGVLMQDQGHRLQPITFLSRQLKPTKQRYSAYEQELAIVADCLQSW